MTLEFGLSPFISRKSVDLITDIDWDYQNYPGNVHVITRSKEKTSFSGVYA